MKTLLAIVCILAYSNACAALRIDSLKVDEAKSQLQIYGSFGGLAGVVTVDSLAAQLESWQPEMIIVTIPDTGKGSAGPVIVTTASEISNAKLLSSFLIDLSYGNYIKDRDWWVGTAEWWRVNWRADLTNTSNSAAITFEVSRSSIGSSFGILPWADSAAISDSCIAVWGVLNLHRQTFDLTHVAMRHPTDHYSHNINISFDSITFDTTGRVTPFSETLLTNQGLYKTVRNLSGKILFPPSPPDPLAVSTHAPLLPDPIHITAADRTLFLQSTTTLPTSTITIYDITGRMLKKVSAALTPSQATTLHLDGCGPIYVTIELPSGQVFSRKLLLL